MPRQRPALWLRVLLLAILFLFASAAFYWNFDDVMEELYPNDVVETNGEVPPLED